MSLIQAQVSCSPIAKLKVTGRLGIFGSEFEGAGGGTSRGTMIHARADYAFTPNISGQLLAEFFTPDDFYVDKDGASFLRAMTFVKF